MQQIHPALAAIALGFLQVGEASQRACVEFLREAGDSMNDAELSLFCRSQFDSAVCEPLARHLGSRPWTPKQTTAVCDEVGALAPENQALERSLHQKLRSSKIIRRCQEVSEYMDDPSIPWDFFYPYCMSELGVENCVVLNTLLAAAGSADSGSRPIGGAAISSVCLDLVDSVPISLSTGSTTTTVSARLLRLFESDTPEVGEVGGALSAKAGSMLAFSGLFTGLLVMAVASIALARQGRNAALVREDNIVYAIHGLSDEATE